MRSRRGREQVDRRSIDDSKKEEGGCKARRSKRRSAGCVHFYRWKVVYTRSILRFSLCACRSFRAALVSWCGARGFLLGVRAFVRSELLCGDDAPRSDLWAERSVATRYSVIESRWWNDERDGWLWWKVRALKRCKGWRNLKMSYVGCFERCLDEI